MLRKLSKRDRPLEIYLEHFFTKFDNVLKLQSVLRYKNLFRSFVITSQIRQ